MNGKEIIDKIILEEQLPRDLPIILKWIVEKGGQIYLDLFISAINKSAIQSRKTNKRTIRELAESEIFILVANEFSNNRKYEESITLFKAMEDKGCKEPTFLNDYGASFLNKAIFGNDVTKETLDKARKLIFKAHSFDVERKPKDYTLPAYKNLCLLRNVEARYYGNQNDNFTAFTLGWISIEMTITRLWNQFIVKNYSNISNSKLKKFMVWNIDSIIEILYISDIHERFKEQKSHVDTIRGVRNDLLHGKKDNPTHGEIERCIKTGYALIPIWN